MRPRMSWGPAWKATTTASHGTEPRRRGMTGEGVDDGARSGISSAMLRTETTICVTLTVLATTGCLRLARTTATTTPPPPQYGELHEKELTKVVPTDKPSATFILDGKPMCFAGSNNYYLIWKSEEMIDSVFQNSKNMGLTVFRQWGHLDAGSMDGKVPHLKDDGTKEGVYFQYWDSEAGKPAYNEGPDGLPRLDFLIKKAAEYDIKLVLTLTNNWADFGGMDQYLYYYGLDKHPQFYTDERVKQAYKDWVTYLLNRVNTLTGVAYKDDPTVFAWELANEPRIRNYTKSDATEGWDRDTITQWAKEMAAHVRSIDPNHLIAVGDEGGFWNDTKPFYNGSDGVDHEALLALDDVDYGTFHLYPDLWSTGIVWADTWIEDHIVAARKAWKPTVLEEYGVGVKRDKEGQIVQGWDRRVKAYRQWNELMTERGGAGIMYWMQAGYDDYRKGRYTDYDGFTVYDVKTDETAQLLRPYTTAFPTKARACELARQLGLTSKREVPAGFATTSAQPDEAKAIALIRHNGWH